MLLRVLGAHPQRRKPAFYYCWIIKLVSVGKGSIFARWVVGAEMVQPMCIPIIEPLSEVGGSETVFLGAILGEAGPEVPEIRMGRSPPRAARSLLI